MHSFIYAVFFSVAVFLSVKMPTDFYTIYWSGVKWTDSLLFLGIVFVVYAIVVLCDFGLNRSEEYFTRTHSDRVLKRGGMVAFVCYAVLFLSWVVTFLAFYPGNISADSYSSIHQAITHIDSTAHPVLFTLLVQFCLKIGLGLFGNMNAAIATFSIVQMLLLDVILTYTVVWLSKHGVPKLFLISSIVYFAFNPLIVRFSFTMWKDILFSGVILLLVLFLYDLATDVNTSLRKNRTLVHFLSLCILVAFLRNRIVYAVLLSFVILSVLDKENRKKLLLAFSLTGFAILIIQGPVYDALNIKQSNFAESQGVTLQQLAAVVVENGEITESEAEFLNQIILLEDIPEIYTASTVDALKGSPSFDHDFLNMHSAEYIEVWKNVVLKNIGISVKAWLMTTRGFWGFNVWIEPFAITQPNEKLDIYQVNFVKNWFGVDLSYISNGILVNLNKVPLVRRLFELGALGWFGLFCCLRQIQKKRYKVLLALLPLTGLWLVLIFTTPIFFEARYMFAYHLALPVLGCMLLMGENLRKQE